MADSVCMNCEQACELGPHGEYIHSGTRQVLCADGEWPCTPILANQLTNFDRWNLNIPDKWED